MNLTKLKEELAKDKYKDDVEYRRDATLADKLNEKTEDGYKVITSGSLLAWAGQNNRFKKIKIAASDLNHPAYSVANVALLLIQRDGTELDVNLSDRMAMLNALVLTQVLEESDKNDILTLAQTKISIAESLGIVDRGELVTSNHIYEAIGVK